MNITDESPTPTSPANGTGETILQHRSLELKLKYIKKVKLKLKLKFKKKN